MSDNDKEIGALTERIGAVERDVKEIKGDISDLNEKVDHLVRIAEREEGARIEREKSVETRRSVVELSWTKVMALAAVIGVIVSGWPMFYHWMIHP